MTARLLDRIQMPDSQMFLNEYVDLRRPVIITNMFDGEPIRDIRTLEDAKAQLGQMKLSVRSEYTSSRGLGSTPEVMTFNEYWDHVEGNRSTSLVCTEYEIPSHLMNLFTLPQVCKREKSENSSEVFDIPPKYGDFDLLENLFVANKGKKAHLHYDGDQRQVLLYQVFGRKDVALFDPREGHRFSLSSRPFHSAAGINLDQMGAEQRLELIGNCGGWYGTLYPGDAIFMPSLIWHHFDYVDDAMSFNLRFGRDEYGRFLCVDNFHRDCFIQNFAAPLSRRDLVTLPGYHNGLDLIKQEYLRPAADIREKVSRMRRLFKKLCMEIFAGFDPEAFTSEVSEEEEVQRCVNDIGMTMRYANPRIQSESRPVGSASASQLSQLHAKAKVLGFTSDGLKHLVRNRTGKDSVELLTKSEVAVMLTYMRSPGAAAVL